MKLKHRTDINKKHNFKTLILSILLGILGILLALGISNMAWLTKISLTDLALKVAITAIIGIPIHEYYHLMTAKLLGYKGKVEWKPLPAIFITDRTTKWGAIGIRLAPLADLTLISVIILIVFQNFFNQYLTIFLVGNLAASASDIIQSCYVFRFADSDSKISNKDGKIEIWEDKNAN